MSKKAYREIITEKSADKEAIDMLEYKKILEKHIIEENGIGYTLEEDDLYYPDLVLPEGMGYEIGKYGNLRCEYLKSYRRAEYIRLLLDGKLNKHLHEIDVECHERMELLEKQMKVSAGISEELKRVNPMKWIGLMNNVRSEVEEIVLKEVAYC